MMCILWLSSETFANLWKKKKKQTRVLINSTPLSILRKLFSQALIEFSLSSTFLISCSIKFLIGSLWLTVEKVNHLYLIIWFLYLLLKFHACKYICVYWTGIYGTESHSYNKAFLFTRLAAVDGPFSFTSILPPTKKTLGSFNHLSLYFFVATIKQVDIYCCSYCAFEKLQLPAGFKFCLVLWRKKGEPLGITAKTCNYWSMDVLISYLIDWLIWMTIKIGLITALILIKTQYN